MSFVDRTLPDVDPFFDLADGTGQRSATFRFELIDGVTDGKIADITPIRGGTLTHDTSKTIKRSLNITLGVEDSSIVDPVNNRVDPYMVLPDGTEYRLGRYVFTDNSRQFFTSGRISSVSLVDEMLVVDQQIEIGISGVNRLVESVITDALKGFKFIIALEASPYTTQQSWGAGTNRGSILQALALTGDYFSPWFDFERKLRFIRSFDPASVPATFDYDAGNQVLRAGIVETDDLLVAPNRFIVISNTNTGSSPVFGTADVPDSAPHSISKRGFVIPSVQDLSALDSPQAQAMANNLALRQTVFERVTLQTPPDPRHDSYDVITWQGERWLELAWSMSLQEGAPMSHVLRKAYS